MVHALHARVGEGPRALFREVADRNAALEVRVLGDEPCTLRDLLEVTPGKALALGDHAEPVRSRGLGGPRVLEDLVGIHHRVHGRIRLRVAGLGAKAAVLSAATGLGVHQVAHVRGIAEALGAHLPRSLHERADLLVRGDRGQFHGLVERDQRGRGVSHQPRTPTVGG